MLTIYIPVIDHHELTAKCLAHFKETVNPAEFRVIIVDNGSDVPYRAEEFDVPFKVNVIRNEENLGGYYPLLQAYTLLLDKAAGQLHYNDCIGLMHNDVFVYEPGWDKRVCDAFAQDAKLGLIGFCGSNEVCDRGGRGGGTMCNFDGRNGQLQQHTGKRVTNLEPAIILDSLTMIFRAQAIPFLRIDENIVQCHFYDKIWSMRIAESGLRVAVLGILIDHMGGQTAVGMAKYAESAARWCKSHGLPYNEADVNSAGHAVYCEAERRMFEEFAPKGMIPCRVDNGYNLHRMFGKAAYPEHMTRR